MAVEYLQDCSWEFVLGKQISVSGCVRHLLFCNFVSLGLSRAEFVHGGSASNPVFSPSIAERLGVRIGVPVQLNSSVPLLSVLSAYIHTFSYRNYE